MPGKTVRKQRSTLIDVREAASILGVAPSTVYYRISNGLLTAWREQGKRTLLLERTEVERARAMVNVVRAN